MKYYKITIIKKITLIFFGFFSSVLLARYLGEGARGTYAYYISLSSLFVVVFNFGINNLYQQAVKEGSDSLKQACFAFSVLIFTLLVFLSLLLSIFSDSLFSWILLLSATSVFRMQVSYYNLIEDIFSSSYIVIIGTVFESLFLLFLFLFANEDIKFALYAFICKEFLVGLLSFILVRKKIKFKFCFSESFLQLSIRFKEIIKVYYFSIVNIVFLKFFLLYFGFLGISEGLGVFTVALLLSEYFWILSDITKDVQLGSISNENEKNILLKYIRVTIFFSVVVYLFFLISGYWFIKYTFGADYVDAYAYTVFLVPAAIMLVPYKLLSVHYISMGLVSVPNKVGSLGVLIMLVMAFVLVPVMGVSAGVYSILLSYSFMGFFISYIYAKENKINILDLFLFDKQDVLIFSNRRREDK